MTRLITDEQILRIHQTLTDITGLVECNCSTAGCEGDCTYATAMALLAELDTLPEAQGAVSGRYTISYTFDAADAQEASNIAAKGLYVETVDPAYSWTLLAPQEDK